MKKLSVFLIVCLSLALSTVALAQDGNLLVGDITGDSAAYYGQQVTVQGNVDELVNIRSFLLGEGGLTNPQLLVLNNSGQEFNIGLTAGAVVQVTGVVYPSYSEGGWDQVMSLTTGGNMSQATGADTSTGAEITVTDAVESAADAAVTEAAGAMQDLQAAATDVVGGAEAMATEAVGGETMATPTPVDMMTGTGGVGLGEYPVILLSDRFPEHTILVVNSMDDIQFVETDNQ